MQLPPCARRVGAQPPLRSLRQAAMPGARPSGLRRACRLTGSRVRRRPAVPAGETVPDGTAGRVLEGVMVCEDCREILAEPPPAPPPVVTREPAAHHGPSLAEVLSVLTSSRLGE